MKRYSKRFHTNIHLSYQKANIKEGFIEEITYIILIMFLSCAESPKKLSNGRNISLLFSKKEPENTKNIYINSKQKTFTKKIITILIIIIGLLLIINIDYLEKLCKRKQQLSLLKEVAKFWVLSKKFPFVPQLSFSLNDNEIICNVGLSCESESIGQGRSYSQMNIDISNCFFLRSIAYSGDGGVIYLTVSFCSMNINYSMLYNCVCSSHGGAIYFSSSNSYLRMICANRCSCGATSMSHFAWLRASQMNQVEYLSISICSYTTSGTCSMFSPIGNQRVDNTNSSMNNAKEYSSIYIDSPSSFSSSYCTFSNNKVSSCVCIGIITSSGTMSYANIVHNNSPSLGVVSVSGAGLRMMYCMFQNNQNTLFRLYSGSLEVSHSFIDHSGSFSTSIAVSTSTNNSFTKKITYQLPFFKSHYCNAQLPVPVPSPMRSFFEMQTPVISSEKSPIRSLQETIRRTNEATLKMTYDNTITQTIRETPINSQNESPINTIDQTIRKTHNETPYRSYAECIFTHQMAFWREINVLFSFVFYIQ